MSWWINTVMINELWHDKTNKMSVRPAKTQISLGIHPVWSESSLCTQWVAKDPRFRHGDSEDSDQTGQMHRLIWVFAGRTLILLVLSWGGSNKLCKGGPLGRTTQHLNPVITPIDNFLSEWADLTTHFFCSHLQFFLGHLEIGFQTGNFFL